MTDRPDYQKSTIPTAHAASHEDGGSDEISVAALSGLLADEQDAGKIKGVTVDNTDIADLKLLQYNAATGKLEYEAPGGGITAYGYLYRDTAYNIASANAWTAIPLTGGEVTLTNITHSLITNPERVQVDLAGTYLINYQTLVRHYGTSHHLFSRLLKNGTTEVLASYAYQGLVNTGTADCQTFGATLLAALAANDYIAIQVATSVNVSNELDWYWNGSMPQPDTYVTARMTLARLAA